MHSLSRSRFFRLVLLALWLVLSGTAFCTETILFFGNSYTYADKAPAVEKLGGVPKLVEAIAAAKGKQTETTMVTKAGKDWAWHLQQTSTEKALTARA